MSLSVSLYLLFPFNFQKFKTVSVVAQAYLDVACFMFLQTAYTWCPFALLDIWASAWDFQQFGMCDQQSLRPACAYAQSDQSLCLSLEYSMIVKLLTERHLEFLSLKGGCRGSSESTFVKMSNCWKSHALAHMILERHSPGAFIYE